MMNNVKALRIAAGMTQKELVYHMGVSQPSVSRWEDGTANPKGKHLEELARLFNVSVGEVLGYDEKEESDKPPVMSELVTGLIDEIMSLPYSQQQLVRNFVSVIKQGNKSQ